MSEKVYIFIFVVFLGVLGLIGRHVWTLGDNEDDYSIVCIDGHQYWRANFATKGFLGIRLGPDGKPVTCE